MIDIILTSQLLNVRNSYIGDYRHIHLRDLCNDCQLPRHAHAKLQHTDLIGWSNLRQGDRHTYLAIGVARCLIHLIFCGKRCRHHLTGSRLSHASGDAYQRQA